ncbi:MAG: PAS domain S-box protein [Chloroflexi bacterium]|nr:PAS domain S-box protein [Chloroflexota bacterium]
MVFANLVFFVLVTALGGIGGMIGKRYRHHLVESEDRYRTLVDALSEGVILLMRDGTITAANAAAERILGVSVDQLMGRASGDPAWQAIREDGSPFPEMEHPSIVALRTGRPSTGVIMGVLTTDHLRRWISINARPLLPPGDPLPYAAVTSFVDVTEARERERALREAEHRYHALFDQAHDAVFILSLEGRHLEANRRASEMAGYTVEELQNLGMHELSAEQEESIQVRARLLKGEVFPTYERLFRRKDGTVIPVEINVEAVRGVDGRPLHIQSVVRDISERKQAEQALRESEARHRALLSAVPDLVFRVRRDGICLDLHANNISELIAPPDQLLGRNMSEFLPPERFSRFQELVELTLETGREHSYEYALPMGGETRHFEGRIVLSSADEVLFIARNITDRKQAQQSEFELVLEKERITLLRQFVEKASHEFRTPLTLINSAAYAMSHYDDAEKRLMREEQINMQVTRITRLLDMMLLMTRLKSAAVRSYTPVDIGTIMDLSCGQMIALEDKPPQLRYERPLMALPHVMGSHADLIEALRQILQNGLQFTPSDGTVTVSAGTDDGFVWIEVRDTGQGISKEHLPYIFASFWRQDDAHTTPGIGLGLPIARTIVEMHGGRIDVESEVGVGSVFRIILPALPKGALQPPAPSLNGRSAPIF